MALDRSVLNDEQWARIAPFLPGKAGDCGVTADNRLFVEAVLWMARTAAPWRDLPDKFGRWNSVFKRFRRWVSRGVFERLFEVMASQLDFEYALIADKAFDTNAIRSKLNEKGALAVIPSKADRKDPIPHDVDMYRWRHLVENYFAKKKSSGGSRPAMTKQTQASKL